MGVSGFTTLTSSGTYLGTENREYLIEIDNEASPDTFRWSVDGGVNFNESEIPIVANTPIPLSSGISVTFSSNTGAKRGDRWRVKAYPINEIVDIHRSGTFAERIEGTKQNLIRAINRAHNQEKRQSGQKIPLQTVIMTGPCQHSHSTRKRLFFATMVPIK